MSGSSRSPRVEKERDGALGTKESQGRFPHRSLEAIPPPATTTPIANPRVPVGIDEDLTSSRYEGIPGFWIDDEIEPREHFDVPDLIPWRAIDKRWIESADQRAFACGAINSSNFDSKGPVEFLRGMSLGPQKMESDALGKVACSADIDDLIVSDENVNGLKFWSRPDSREIKRFHSRDERRRNHRLGRVDQVHDLAVDRLRDMAKARHVWFMGAVGPIVSL